MDKFIPRQEGYQKFLEWREKLNKAEDEYSQEQGFNALFDKAVKTACEGDAILQDVVAYYYKRGVGRRLYEDYQKYIHWEILSASAGNEFAIEKLQFFLGYAYDQVVAHPEFPKIKYYNGIDENNYIYIIGQKLCEQLVEDLNIDAVALARTKDEYLPYRPEYFRDFRRAIDMALPVVIEQMKNNRRT